MNALTCPHCGFVAGLTEAGMERILDEEDEEGRVSCVRCGRPFTIAAVRPRPVPGVRSDELGPDDGVQIEP